MLFVHRCPCVHGDVRLAASPDPTAGRVEVCYFGVWGTVTDDGWNNVDSNVVCRQLGFWGNGKPLCTSWVRPYLCTSCYESV